MYTTTQLKKIRTIVRDFLEHPEKLIKDQGLCCNINARLPDNYDIYAFVEDIVPTWSEFSGDRKYPVPHPEYNPKDAYMQAISMYFGEYGEARMRLLKFIDETLTTYLEDLNK